MPKGYWVAHVTITDPDKYPDYLAAAKPAFEEYGARFLARGGNHDCVEGATGERHVIIEFESFAKALACYNSDAYQKAAAIRQATATSTLTVIEGTD